MDVFLAACQGLGLALAAGIGGLLVILFASVLAHVEVGWDLEGTDFGWFASEWFIAILFALNLVAFLLRRRASPQIASAAVLVAVTALAAILFAASLAEETSAWGPGLIAGAAAGFVSARLAQSVLAGAGERAGEAGEAVPLIVAGTGAILAIATLLVPPISLLAAVGMAVLAAGRQRRGGRKYEGLRTLR
jgi:hypothetical protein